MDWGTLGFVGFFILALAGGLWAATQSNLGQARTGNHARHIDITVKSKQHKAFQEEERAWLIVSTDGDEYNPYLGHFEAAGWSGPKLYRQLKEGHSYRCEVYGAKGILGHRPVLKNCMEQSR
jgi:hypothetical protein